MSYTIFVQIGNSDDKLSQAEWSDYAYEVSDVLNVYSDDRHFFGLAPADAPWQNACWCVVFNERSNLEAAKIQLAGLAKFHGQRSIAWSEAKTEFIEGVKA